MPDAPGDIVKHVSSKKVLSGRSLYIFPPFHPFRRKCHAIVHSSTAEFLVLVVIMVNAFSLAYTRQASGQTAETFDLIEYIALGIFTYATAGRQRVRIRPG